MLRAEAEARITDKVREISEILKEYNPESDYLSICIRLSEDYFSFNNRSWPGGQDEDMPIEHSSYKERNKENV